ncbi:MAG: hypothetical protein KGK17_00345, partial [Betaproteobacteria bacterium]|nr:hypothetical protein [Betaproteobacteria bacterium]
NENLSILARLGAYARVIHADIPIRTMMQNIGIESLRGRPLVPTEAAFYASVILLGLFISGLMLVLYRRYRHVEYTD